MCTFSIFDSYGWRGIQMGHNVNGGTDLTKDIVVALPRSLIVPTQVAISDGVMWLTMTITCKINQHYLDSFLANTFRIMKSLRLSRSLAVSRDLLISIKL